MASLSRLVIAFRLHLLGCQAPRPLFCLDDSYGLDGASPSAGCLSGSARVGRPWPSSWFDCWLPPPVVGSGRSGQVSCGPFCRPLAVGQRVRAPFVEQLGYASAARLSPARCALAMGEPTTFMEPSTSV